MIVNVTLTLRHLDYPLDKSFGGIPAGSSGFIHASVRLYETSEFLRYEARKSRPGRNGPKTLSGACSKVIILHEVFTPPLPLRMALRPI